jgi:hypothetical protein
METAAAADKGTSTDLLDQAMQANFPVQSKYNSPRVGRRCRIHKPRLNMEKCMNKILLGMTLSLLAIIAGHDATRAAVSVHRGDDRKFIVGVLRADGTLVPFAEYGNGGWYNPWPNPGQISQRVYAASIEAVPHSLGDLSEPWFRQCGKIPTNWYFSSPSGAFTQLRASKVVKVENHSQANWGLLTDFPKEQSAESDHCQDCNIGVALTIKEKIEPTIKVNANSSEDKDILSFVKQVFDEQETQELNRIRAERTPAGGELSMLSLSSEERKHVGLSATILYRTKSPVNGEHIYYFEAQKEYKASQNGRACSDISLFQGWISTQGKGGLGLMDSNLVFTDCDIKGPSFMTPLGVMTLKDRAFLFVTEHGWEDESYLILELNNSGLHRVLETFGG